MPGPNQSRTVAEAPLKVRNGPPVGSLISRIRTSMAAGVIIYSRADTTDHGTCNNQRLRRRGLSSASACRTVFPISRMPKSLAGLTLMR